MGLSRSTHAAALIWGGGPAWPKHQCLKEMGSYPGGHVTGHVTAGSVVFFLCLFVTVHWHYWGSWQGHQSSKCRVGKNAQLGQ